MQEWSFAAPAFLASYPAFKALDPATQRELARALEPVELRPGDLLFTAGEPRDAVFFILCGSISLTPRASGGRDLPARVIGPGEAVGEIGMVADEPHASSARALDETLVLRLSRVRFEEMSERYPEAAAALSVTITPAARKILLAGLLCDLLGELDASNRDALLEEIGYRQLSPGDVLFRQGEAADRMFIVVYGRLRTVSLDPEGKESIVDEAGRGETIGQRSVLAGEVHSTTVYALRASAVGVITRSVFELLEHQYPEVVEQLERIAARRLQAASARRPAPSNAPHVASIAVLPVGAPPGRVPLADFAARLAAALSVLGPAFHLTSARVDSLVGTSGIAEVERGHPSEPMLDAWLKQQDESHHCVIYEADATWTPWTERCLRMSDRVLLVGAGDGVPVATELDEPLARLSDSTRTVLVLLHGDGKSRPSGTAAWLDQYPAAGHDHVRLGRQADYERFVRHITGRGLGLVLGGGGARGWAHAGVFKALAECAIEVDLVGGTSMGAVLGGMFALGLEYEAILELARQLASPLKLFDPTIPAVSFFASNKVTHVLQRIYGDAQIEDLWIPCFCVSSNLTRAVAMVHRRGSLWQAVRASMAIPGIFSPMLADGDLLVDGCVLNNLPIDVMQRVNYGGPIIAVNVFPDVDLLRDYEFGPSVSGWQALANKVNPFVRRDSSAPLIFESLVRVLALNGVHQAKIQRGLADVFIRPPVEQFNILDFGAYQDIAEIGYRSAVQALGEWEAAPARKPGLPDSGHGIADTPGHAPARRGRATAALHDTLAQLEEVLGRMST